MSVTLSSLPNEILRHVAQLAGNDVQNLRMANKSINAAVDPVMWEMLPIIVNFNKENLKLSMEILEELSREPTNKLKFRRLDIKSLDPSKEYYPSGVFWWDHFRRAKPSRPADTEAIMETHRRLPEILPKALSALTGLRSIKWYITGTSLDCTTYELVLEPLGHLLHLVDVEITANVDTTRLPLHHLKNGSLRRLAIRQSSGLLSFPRHLITSLAAVFIQNPRLVHLELDVSKYGTSPLPFEDLFQNIPRNTLQLCSLLLSGWSIQASPQMLPHLQSLTSIEFPSSWKSDSAAFWKSLIDSSPDAPLPFVRISCSDTPEELLDVLQCRSIPGLETLEFKRAGADTDERSDRFAQRFYNSILCQYHNALTELSLIPSYTGDWTIGFRNLGIFDECKQLRKLSVGLDPSEILPGSKEKDIVASFITRVVQLPNLSTISLHPVTSKQLRGARCGTGLFMESQSILERTQNSIEEIKVPAACHLVHGRFRIVIPSRMLYLGKSTVEFIPEVDNGTSEVVRFRRCP